MTDFVGEVEVTISGNSEQSVVINNYEGEVSVDLSVQAQSIVIFNFVGSGSISVSVDETHTVDYYYGTNAKWSIYNNTEYNYPFYWTVGREPMRWYTIEFRCPVIQSVGDGNTNGCVTPGVNIINDPRCEGCDPAGYRYFEIISARDVSDLCSKLKERSFTNPINCPIVSVKRGDFVFKEDQDTLGDGCNKITQLDEDEYCLIPECMDFCIDQVLYSFVGVKSYYQRSYSFTGSVVVNTASASTNMRVFNGGLAVNLDGEAQVANSNYTYDGEVGVTISGEAEVINSYYEFEGSVGIVLDGEAYVEYARYSFVGSGGITVLVDAESRSSYLGEFSASVGLISKLSNLQFVPSEIATENTLTIGQATVDTTCGCTALPLNVQLATNLASNNLLGNFLTRNRSKLNQSLSLLYRKEEDAWINNFQFSGLSDDGVTTEKWNGFFELACTNELAGDISTVKFWKLSIFIRKLNINRNEDFDTRLLFAFPSDICLNNELNFTFYVDAFKQTYRSDRNVFVDVRVFYDNIGMFKNAYWIKNPELSFVIHESVSTSTENLFNIRPIFSDQPILI